MTQKVDAKVRQCATVLGDNILLGKLAMGDMIANEAKYHPGCLLSLYQKALSAQKCQTICSSSQTCQEFKGESLELAEMMAYIEDVKCTEVTPSVFKLGDLVSMYSTKLDQYGVAQSRNDKCNSF